ncbi:Short-chain dehydrogenase chry4 [Neonectria punicea]|uniref:Short-chain dehydrogenase chry4 n=1 Tax=Neonectria punicea TaxID=979145 RepID=A0ABR1GJG8_9HYPO
MARILITGSTDGFGLEAARQLVQRNHTVYLHAWSQERQGAPGKLEDGVETYVMLAEGDYDQTLTGVEMVYFDPKKKRGEPLAVTADQDLQEAAVKACEDITGLKLVASQS